MIADQPANDDGPRKSAIVTTRKPRSWHGDAPEMTPAEHQRRGDAADAMFREMKRRIAAAVQPSGALPPKKPGAAGQCRFPFSMGSV